MANAKQWAESQGLCRNNPVHGKQEFRIPTDWTFSHKNMDRMVTTASASCDLEAGPFMASSSC